MIIDNICIGCKIFAHVNDLGLCADCNVKFDWDLFRVMLGHRDWDYLPTACFLPDDQREARREQIIHEYESNNELLTDEKPRKRKNKRSNSRNTKRKRGIAVNAFRDYDTEDVLQSARDYLQAQNDEWVNFSKVSQHVYERFYNLKP